MTDRDGWAHNEHALGTELVRGGRP
jgi:hypothetical protein